MVGGAAGGAVRAGKVLAGLGHYPGESLAPGGEHIGLDVVAHHPSAGGVGAEVGQCGGEERRDGLPTTSASVPAACSGPARNAPVSSCRPSLVRQYGPRCMATSLASRCRCPNAWLSA